MGDTEETVAHQAVEVNENEVVNVENDQQDQQQQSKDGEEVGDEEGKKKKPMAPRSDVWEHFSKIRLDNGEERAKCKYCSKQLRCDTKLNGEKLWATVNTYFRALFEEYRELYAPSPSDKVPAETQETPEFCSGLMSSIIAQQMSNKGSVNATVKSELDKYLSEDNEELSKSFDILKWWKNNATRFPIMSCMARDLLAIPISTVASESAFSSGGRTLDDFRTSLTPSMVDRLVCTNDRLSGNNYINVEEDTEALGKLEEEIGALAICSKDSTTATAS